MSKRQTKKAIEEELKLANAVCRIVYERQTPSPSAIVDLRSRVIGTPYEAALWENDIVSTTGIVVSGQEVIIFPKAFYLSSYDDRDRVYGCSLSKHQLSAGEHYAVKDLQVPHPPTKEELTPSARKFLLGLFDGEDARLDTYLKGLRSKIKGEQRTSLTSLFGVSIFDDASEERPLIVEYPLVFGGVYSNGHFRNLIPYTDFCQQLNGFIEREGAQLIRRIKQILPKVGLDPESDRVIKYPSIFRALNFEG